ncbi:helix-turn-helix domain-containing protein [Mucilaginibacter koreensis]
MNLQPEPYYPQHPLLKEHISYFYFLRTDADFEAKYYAFPHTHTVLNIHQHAATVFEQQYITRVYGDVTVPYLTSVQGIREVPLLAHLCGCLNKVTILFKPLGLNQFIRSPLQEIIISPSQLFTHWDHSPGYSYFLKKFYATSNNHIRAQLLEAYLLQQYCPLPEYQLLKRAVELLSDFEAELPIEEISIQIGLKERTFNRLFNRHLGVSPVTYRKVARFRHSLQNKLFEKNFNRMTDLAYRSNFYDQAYFNKIYKKLTGLNPQKFFSDINQLADDQLIFQFIKSEVV